MAGRSDDFDKSKLWTCFNFHYCTHKFGSECIECGDCIDIPVVQEQKLTQKNKEPGTSATASAQWLEEPKEDPGILAAFGLIQCPAGHIYKIVNGECNFCVKRPSPRRVRTPEPEPLPPGHFNPFRLPNYECTADGWCVGYNPIHPHLRAAHEAEQKAKEQEQKQKEEQEDREKEEERENREYREEARRRRNRRLGQGE